jgi:hypothetical protein
VTVIFLVLFAQDQCFGQVFFGNVNRFLYRKPWGEGLCFVQMAPQGKVASLVAGCSVVLVIVVGLVVDIPQKTLPSVVRAVKVEDLPLSQPSSVCLKIGLTHIPL